MSTLTFKEKAKLEKLFDMHDGYVSNFSNSTFAAFFADEVGIDIDNEKYCATGGSKAKRFREFWRLDADYIVGKALKGMIEREEDVGPYYNQSSEEKERLLKAGAEIAQRLMSGEVNLDNLKETAIIFNAEYLKTQIRRIESSINEDPALAIGTAKELVETCCKTILAERGKPVEGMPDIPTLTKKTLKELNLVPENIHNEARGSDVIKRLLQNLGTIGNGLAELRSLYGTGHGKHGSTSGLSSRHARLAVGAASTLVTFLFDTHMDTKRD